MGRLRRVSSDSDGISRRRRGRGFAYLDAQGRRVTDDETLERIRALAIPPAWTDVWICPDPHGHLQAVGTDAAGRRQYLYHPRWRSRRDRQKFDRMLDFARALPTVRRAVDADPRGRDLDARPRARLRGPAARPRALPHRQRGVRGGERQLRARDAGAAARHASTTAARSSSTTRARPACGSCSTVVDPEVHAVLAR